MAMFSTYALVGLGVGLAFAVLDYLVLLPLIERPMRAGLGTVPPMERERLARRIQLVRVVFLWQFLVFPVVGYVVGRVLDAGATP